MDLNKTLRDLCRQPKPDQHELQCLADAGAVVDEFILMFVRNPDVADWLMTQFKFSREKIIELGLIHSTTGFGSRYFSYKMSAWLLKNVYIAEESKSAEETTDNLEVTLSTLIDAIRSDGYEFVELYLDRFNLTIDPDDLDEVMKEAVAQEKYDRCEWLCSKFDIDPDKYDLPTLGPKAASKTH